MRVTEYYSLDRTQATVDFVDVDTATDNRIFIDPRAIRIQDGYLEDQCVAYLISFFSEVLNAIRDGRPDRVRGLMHPLGEPNETHLGFSRGPSRGRGLTGKRSEEIADAISSSRAAATGLLEDLEDTSLLVPGVGKDLISDMTTHIIRGALIDYTQHVCDYYGIPTEQQHSGFIWDSNSLEWRESFVDLPRTPEGKLLLVVPKTIVRHALIFDSDQYFKDYIAPLLEAEELQAGSQLVQLLKNGRRRVTKKALRAKYGTDKIAVVDQTLRLAKRPLLRYREMAGRITSPPLDNEDLTETVGGVQISFIELYEKMTAVQPGTAGATLYHRCAEQLLSAALYPSLGNMKIEKEIHEGRKRIDICYDNVATTGFFDWLNRGYSCPVIPVECKNYQNDIGNPELDQMIGRFSDHRGRFGIILCRSFNDKEHFLVRCKDTANDRNGYIIVLDDDDMHQIALRATELQRAPRSVRLAFPLLRSRFDLLIS